MSEEKTLDILKGAILLEHRGKALYESVGRESKVGAVKELFEALVREENNHIEILSRQFQLAADGKSFDVSDLESIYPDIDQKILSGDLVKEISGAGYEAAVISAGLEFEKNAVEYYGKQAAEAGSSEERELYRWLSEWEKSHMEMFAQLDHQLREQVWYDNQFWPF